MNDDTKECSGMLSSLILRCNLTLEPIRDKISRKVYVTVRRVQDTFKDIFFGIYTWVIFLQLVALLTTADISGLRF
jgi:hypothetical protein